MSEPVKRVRDYRAWASIAALFVASIAFALIAALVATKDPILQRDLQVLVWLHTHGSPIFSAFLLSISQLHSLVGITVFSLLLGIALWKRRKWHWLAALGLAVPGGMLLNAVLKWVFHRDRPVWDDPIISLSTASFPSGHAAAATLFYGFFTVYILSHVESLALRVTCVIAAMVMVALVAFSRMYLGVHYLSDVLAAISMSTAWLVLCLTAVRFYIKRHAAA